MSWCERCFSDHDGPCLEESKRLELGRELAALLNRRSEPCPFCGGRGAGGPYGLVPMPSRCSYCGGTGRMIA